jgi:CubicO group peptidase (beta-lactamase class C family)
VTRAAGEDFQVFAQRELFGKLGIARGEWQWRRDAAGHTQGFFGLNMSTNNFAKLGELMRRGGRWGGEQLLPKRFVREALTPTATNGCYGYLIWLNSSKPCVGPRVTSRPVTDARLFPSLPPDTYQYAGLFGQWVTVFPSYGIIVARNGGDSGSFTGSTGWQEEMYRKVLGAVRNPPRELPPPRRNVPAVSDRDSDRGFFEALQDPDKYSGGMNPPPLPPAGPARARASLLNFVARKVGRDGRVRVRVRCPPVWSQPGLGRRCEGVLRLQRARRAKRYRIDAGSRRTLALRLRAKAVRKLRRGATLPVTATGRNRDRAAGTPARQSARLLARAKALR